MTEPAHVDNYTMRSARRQVAQWPTWPQALPGGPSGWLWRMIVTATAVCFVCGGWAWYWWNSWETECHGIPMQPGDVCQVYSGTRQIKTRTYEEMASDYGFVIPWVVLAVGAVIGTAVVGSMVRRAREVRLPTEAEIADFMQSYNARCAELQRTIDFVPAATSAPPELAAVRLAAAELAEQNGFRIDGSTATLL
ncbi:hypothetical protein LB823_15300 [Tsukamurella sp. M9C]|uniref:hypothetical protein n=1 Tax=Tsukamurella sp. M9C TaxID=2877520 RepID=UPI001CCC28CD|nr:hypothetical protein [Tsukamurella sp. M9C]MCA0157559.1 hypothetical protein [Tsukamurella sp. M9C]